jgi:hypothetical protein
MSPNVMAASIAAATVAILVLSLLISFINKRRSPGAMAQA